MRARLLLKGLLEETAVTVGRRRPVQHPAWRATTDVSLREQTELVGAVGMPGHLSGSGVLTVPDNVELAAVASLSRTTGLLDQLTYHREHTQQVDDWSRRLPAGVPPLLNLVRALLDETTTS